MNEVLDYRRALEALRNGVPNRDAVKVVGCGQTEIERRFRENLELTPEHLEKDKQVRGMLVSGDFGAGKSHLLQYLQHLALSENFVCSRVVISKETPLADPAKVFKAAIESAEVPGLSGQAIQEIAARLRRDSAQYAALRRWCERHTDTLNPLFAATLLLHERLGGDPEMVEKIVGFWSGEALGVARIRRSLKQAGADSLYRVRNVPARELALHRFAFIPQFIAGAGYRGWVLLLDEVELIGRYSLLQRAKSYGELARWLGWLKGEQYPGLVTVAAITEDFDAAVLVDKDDYSSIRQKLEDKGREEYRVIAARAETGMRIIRREALALEPPDERHLLETYRRLKDVHAKAHGWNPPEIPMAELATTRRIRSHVRRWITQWDLHRLFPDAAVTTEEKELHPAYTQDVEVEKPAEEPPPEDVE
ncbi:MAG TPA: BREX system ATP-binding domain-containing protein [Candidatus Binataceae bacterium]|nr:BREX system ATP-binding domain-containing protein [Candidatus Binataceae bacterium]